MSDGQLYVAVWALFMAAETAAALLWRHHQNRRHQTDTRRYLNHLAQISQPRSVPPASGQHRRRIS